MEQIAKQVIFKGRVQGVGFRYTTHRIGRQYDLSGYVRNLPDSSVEAVFQGTGANIQACMDDIQDTFSGYIRDIKSTDQPVNPEYHDFKIAF
ncbi:MAG: acylphosphatase [Phycisphaerae bacterium]|nr:acylphosphatase [Phycisphaerae bacterium]